MILAILKTFKTLSKEYPLSRVVLKGMPAVFRGIYLYFLNKRAHTYKLSIYVNYFIVLAVTGRDPLNPH